MDPPMTTTSAAGRKDKDSAGTGHSQHSWQTSGDSSAPQHGGPDPTEPAGSATRTSDQSSFWKRQVSRIPGSIRPASGSNQDNSKLVDTADLANIRPSFEATSKNRRNSSSSTSPRVDRKAVRSREEYINDMSDAWGEVEGPRRETQSPVKPTILSSPPKPHSRAASTRGDSHTQDKYESKPFVQRSSTDPSVPLSPAAQKAGLRHEKFQSALASGTVELGSLRKLAWNGIPDEFRPMCWQLLMGYLPCLQERRETTLSRKRKEYEDMVAQCLGKMGAQDKALEHQIHIDILRTNPTPIYSNPRIQKALERVLYCWAMRHPASGYVQGINDLLTPFFSVYLSPFIGTSNNVESVTEEQLSMVEADSFWCLTKLIDGIQDNYTFAQPGIQRQVARLRDLIGRIDQPLAAHLTSEGIEFIQFSFRWMNCLLMREVTHRITIRMWDTYLSEEGDLNDFHLYVCAAFLVKWTKELQKMQFADIMLFLQSPPTKEWTEKDIELILSEAFMWKSLFHNSPSHFSK